jgi:hypothetical protein
LNKDDAVMLLATIGRNSNQTWKIGMHTYTFIQNVGEIARKNGLARVVLWGLKSIVCPLHSCIQMNMKVLVYK